MSPYLGRMLCCQRVTLRLCLSLSGGQLLLQAGHECLAVSGRLHLHRSQLIIQVHL